MKKRGMTLIEVLVYLALYAMLMTGTFSAVYGLFASSDRDATSAMVEEEGDFLLGKIEWTLANARTIEEPTNSGSGLIVIDADGSDVSIAGSGTDMQMRSNGTASILNNDTVAITDLSFTHQSSASSESVEASFTLHATTSAGLPLSRTFSTLDYLSR